VFVDSSGWIALFSLRDAHHREADRLFRSAIERSVPLLTTNLVAAEVHRLLLFRAGIPAATRALDVLDRSGSLTMHFAVAADHRAARAWIGSSADQKITYTDAVSFAVMKAAGVSTFLGFDRDFDVAGFDRWRG
jgi:predicted nucleic acid-binding protein